MKFLTQILSITILATILSSMSCDEQTTSTPNSTPKVLNFTIPKNTSEPACLRLVTSMGFNFSYVTENSVNGSTENVTIYMQDYDDYDGDCGDKSNILNIKFMSNWEVNMVYTLDKDQYELSQMEVSYVVDSKNFPNVSSNSLGPHTISVNMSQFSASKGNSYKCNSETDVVMASNLTVNFFNFQVQPFIDKDKKNNDFDTAIDCPADITGTSKLVPIIVGSALTLLVVLVLIAYVIGRRKHRPGYTSV